MERGRGTAGVNMFFWGGQRNLRCQNDGTVVRSG